MGRTSRPYGCCVGNSGNAAQSNRCAAATISDSVLQTDHICIAVPTPDCRLIMEWRCGIKAHRLRDCGRASQRFNDNCRQIKDFEIAARAHERQWPSPDWGLGTGAGSMRSHGIYPEGPRCRSSAAASSTPRRLHRSLGRRISLLSFDAPIFELVEWNGLARYRADHMITGAQHSERAGHVVKPRRATLAGHQHNRLA